MVMDYADLDLVVKPVIDELDHAFITCGDEPVYKALCVVGCTSTIGKIANIGVRTTAENIATYIATQIMYKLNKSVDGLLGVSVSETPKTSAEVILEV
jgi:6-pyruvoyl-tetrahydropterin synthase